MGLGLAVVYGIIEAHGGEIDVGKPAGAGHDIPRLRCRFPAPRARARHGGGPGGPGGACRWAPVHRVAAHREVEARTCWSTPSKGRVGDLRLCARGSATASALRLRRRPATSTTPTRILRDVLPRTARRRPAVLAVTEADLFIPMLTFVFGQAQLGGPGGAGLHRAAPAGVLRAPARTPLLAPRARSRRRSTRWAIPSA